MELNWIIFPAPSPNYFWDLDFRHEGHLIFVPNQKDENVTDDEHKSSDVPFKDKSKRWRNKNSSFPWYYIPYKRQGG